MSSPDEFPVERLDTAQNDDGSGKDSLVITVSPPRNKKRAQSVMPPKFSEARVIKRRTTETVAKLNKENATNSNGARVQEESAGETLTRIRDDIAVVHKKKLSLMKSIGAESKTARVASNRANQLEEKLKFMASDKAKSDARREDLEKEVSELRKKAQVLEQRISRLGSRAETFQMKKEIANLQFVQSVEFEHVAQQKKEIEMTKAQISERLFLRERQLAELKGSYLEMETELLQAKRSLEVEIGSLSSQLSAAQLSLTQTQTKSGGLDSQIAIIQERVSRLLLEKQSKDADLALTITLLDGQLKQSVWQWEEVAAALAQSKRTLELAQLTLVSHEQRARKADGEVSELSNTLTTNQTSWLSMSADLAGRLGTLEEALSTLQAQNIHLVESLGKVRDRNGHLSTDLVENQKKLASLQKLFEEIGTQRNRLALQFQMMQNEASAATGRLSTERANVASLSLQLEDARRENSELASAVLDLQASMSELALQVQEAASDLDQEHSAVELLQRERDEVLEERERSESTIAENLAQIAELETDIVSLRDELSTLKVEAEKEKHDLSLLARNGAELLVVLKADQESLLTTVEELQADVERRNEEIEALGVEVEAVSATYENALDKISALEQEHEEFEQAARAQIVESRGDFRGKVDSLNATMEELHKIVVSLVAKDKQSREDLESFEWILFSSESAYSKELQSKSAEIELLKNVHGKQLEEVNVISKELTELLSISGSEKTFQANEVRILAAKLERADANVVELTSEARDLHASVSALTSKIAEHDMALSDSLRRESASEQAMSIWQERVRNLEDNRREGEQKLVKAEAKYADVHRTLAEASKGEQEARVTLNQTKARLESELSQSESNVRSEMGAKESLAIELASTRMRLTEIEQQLTLARTEFAALKAKSIDDIARITKVLEQKQTAVDSLTSESNMEREKKSEVKLELLSAQEKLHQLREGETKLKDKIRELKDDFAKDKEGLMAMRTDIAAAKGEAGSLRREIQSTRELCDSLGGTLSRACEEEKLARMELARYSERDHSLSVEKEEVKERVEALARRKIELKLAMQEAQSLVSARRLDLASLDGNLLSLEEEQTALKKEREERLTSISQIQQAMSELSTQLQAMAQFQSATVSELENTRTKLDDAESQSSLLSDTLEQVAKELVDAQMMCEEEQTRAAEVESQIDSLQLVLDETRSLLSDATLELETLSKDLFVIQQERDTLQAALTETAGALGRQLESLSVANSELLETSYLGEFVELDELVARSELATVDAQIKSSKGKWLQTQEELAHSEEQRLVLQAEMKGARQQVTQARLQASQAQRDVFERDEELSFKAQQLALLNGHFSTASELAAVLLGNKANLQARINETEASVAGAKQALDSTNGEVTALQFLVNASEEKARISAALVESKEAELTLLASKWESTLAKIAELSDSQDSNYTLQDSLTSILAEHLAEVGSRSAIVKTIQEELKRAKETLSTHEKSHATFIQRVAEMELHLEQLKESQAEHTRSAQHALEHGLLKQTELLSAKKSSAQHLREDIANSSEKALAETSVQNARLSALQEQLRAAEGELAALEEQKRLEEADKEAALTANTVDARRTHAQVSHDLSITRRELQRLRDTVKLRDTKLGEFKAKSDASQVSELSNQVLREQAAARDQEARKLNEELRKLKATMTKNATATNDAKQSAVDLAKRERLIAELEAKVCAFEAVQEARIAELEELRNLAMDSSVDKSLGKYYFEEAKKEAAQLKKEKIDLQSQTARLKQAQLKVIPGTQQRLDQQ